MLQEWDAGPQGKSGTYYRRQIRRSTLPVHRQASSLEAHPQVPATLTIQRRQQRAPEPFRLFNNGEKENMGRRALAQRLGIAVWIARARSRTASGDA